MARLIRGGRAVEAAAIAPEPEFRLQARIVATGLNQAYGIRKVGRFDSSGPFSANPKLLLQTQPGRVLDPAWVPVAMGDNLGARSGNVAPAAGAVLSIKTRGLSEVSPLVVSADLSIRQLAPDAALRNVGSGSAQVHADALRAVHRARGKTGHADDSRHSALAVAICCSTDFEAVRVCGIAAALCNFAGDATA